MIIDFLEKDKGQYTVLQGGAASGKTMFCVNLIAQYSQTKRILFLETDVPIDLQERLKPFPNVNFDNIIQGQSLNIVTIQEAIATRKFDLVIIDDYRGIESSKSMVNMPMASHMQKSDALMRRLAKEHQINIIATVPARTNISSISLTNIQRQGASNLHLKHCDYTITLLKENLDIIRTVIQNASTISKLKFRFDEDLVLKLLSSLDLIRVRSISDKPEEIEDFNTILFKQRETNSQE